MSYERHGFLFFFLTPTSHESAKLHGWRYLLPMTRCDSFWNSFIFSRSVLNSIARMEPSSENDKKAKISLRTRSSPTRTFNMCFSTLLCLPCVAMRLFAVDSLVSAGSSCGSTSTQRAIYQHGCLALPHFHSLRRVEGKTGGLHDSLCHILSLRGGWLQSAGENVSECHGIDDAFALFDQLRGSSDATREQYIHLLDACVRLSEAGEVQGSPSVVFASRLQKQCRP